MSGQYVVKATSGQYVSHADRFGNEPWVVRAWSFCQNCACRFSRDDAHTIAHGGATEWLGERQHRVIRIVRRRDPAAARKEG